MGKRVLLDAWLAMMRGEEEGIPDLFGAEQDPFARLGVEDTATSTPSPSPSEGVLQPHLLITSVLSFDAIVAS